MVPGSRGRILGIKQLRQLQKYDINVENRKRYNGSLFIELYYAKV